MIAGPGGQVGSRCSNSADSIWHRFGNANTRDMGKRGYWLFHEPRQRHDANPTRDKDAKHAGAQAHARLLVRSSLAKAEELTSSVLGWVLDTVNPAHVCVRAKCSRNVDAPESQDLAGERGQEEKETRLIIRVSDSWSQDELNYRGRSLSLTALAFQISIMGQPVVVCFWCPLLTCPAAAP
jgi:hypothetical protein